MSLRRWWWNNYEKTVLPVPSLHNKWLSGNINFTPAINHNLSLPLPSWKWLAAPLAMVETHLLTQALFIFNRCRVEGPVQNGSHLSSINNSVIQTHREEHAGKCRHPHAGLHEKPTHLKVNTHTQRSFSSSDRPCCLRSCGYCNVRNGGLCSSCREIRIQDGCMNSFNGNPPWTQKEPWTKLSVKARSEFILSCVMVNKWLYWWT